MSSVRIRISQGNKKIFECENRDHTFKKMQNFFKDRKFCDVILIAGKDNTKVSAHRIILSAASEYFLDLLDNSTGPEITIKDVNGEMLQLLVNFIYTATLEISAETVDDIMKTASVFKLEAVITECSDYLAKKLDNANCLPVAVFSLKHNYMDLCEKALMYASEHFVKLLDEEAFLQLDIEPLCRLLRRSDLCVESEEDVFNAVKVWIGYDEFNRNDLTFKLLSNLRFPLLKLEFITNEVEPVCKTPDCQTLVIRAIKFHLTTPSRSLFPAEHSTPRNAKREIMMVKARTDPGAAVIAEAYDRLLSEWKQKQWPARPHLAWYAKAILMDGKVYLAGTSIRNSTIDRIDCFDLTTNEWSKLPSMGAQRYSFGLANLNGQLYVIGGTNGKNNLRSVERWDPNLEQRWQEMAPMRTARSEPGVAVLNGLLYVVGCNSDYEDNTFEYYDPQTDTWTELNPPRKARIGVGLAAVNGTLYAVGGRTKRGLCTKIERYNPKTDYWMGMKTVGKFQRYLQCTSCLDRLIVLTEFGEGRDMYILEEYNPELEQWRTMNPLQRFYGGILLVTQ